MTDLILFGFGLTTGIVFLFGILAGVVGWLCRGHRVDLTQVRAINVWQENDHRASFGPRRIIEKDRVVKQEKPRDFYDEAHERGDER